MNIEWATFELQLMGQVKAICVTLKQEFKLKTNRKKKKRRQQSISKNYHPNQDSVGASDTSFPICQWTSVLSAQTFKTNLFSGSERRWSITGHMQTKLGSEPVVSGNNRVENESYASNRGLMLQSTSAIRAGFVNAGTHHLYLMRINVSLKLDTKECVCPLSMPTPLHLNYKLNWVQGITRKCTGFFPAIMCIIFHYLLTRCLIENLFSSQVKTKTVVRTTVS